MKCPICQSETKVIDSRPQQKGTYRRRECTECLTRFTTQELVILESMEKHLLERYFNRLA